MTLGPAETAISLQAQIVSKTTWIDQFGQGAKRPRPQHEVARARHDLAALKTALNIVQSVALGQTNERRF
jgi:hypothetical protein